MPGEVRTILNELDARTLRRLCRQRELPTGGDLHDKRSRLARSFRGDVGGLIPELRREDMIAALEIWEFTIDGRTGALVGLRGASRQDLRRAMKRIFVDDWEPSERSPQPFRGGFSIRIGWEDEDLGEEEDPPNLARETEDDDPDDSADEPPDPDEELEERGREADFGEWIAGHLAGRPAMTLLIKTLVNRLGRYHAEHRLTTRAMRDVGLVLARAGLATEPDLTQIARSPGIQARVRVTRRAAGKPVTTDWAPVPAPPPANLLGAVRAAHSPMPAVSEFERSAAKLKFLVTVAGSIQKLGEPQRLEAVERAAHGASLSAADRVRLRAMAHQYASGHEDLGATLRQLRVTLSEPERRELLSRLRELAPATAELDELISAYATDLALGSPAGAPVGTAARSVTPVSIPWTREDAPDPPPVGEVIAGGVRDNAALDTLFDRKDP